MNNEFREEAKRLAQFTARDRTLAAYKARGGKLGGSLPQCRNLTPDAIAKGRENSIKARAKAAVEDVADLKPLMVEMRARGHTLQAIANELNRQDLKTRRQK